MYKCMEASISFISKAKFQSRSTKILQEHFEAVYMKGFCIILNCNILTCAVVYCGL
jgi:hypothetical protein